MTPQSARWWPGLYTPGRVPPTRGALLGRVDEAGRADGRATEAAGDAVHRPRQVLPPHGGGVEQRELAARLGPKGGGRQPDEPDRLDQPLAGEQRGRPAVELQPVLGGITGVAARQRPEVGPPQLERDPAGGEPLGAQLARDPLRLAAQRLLQPRELAAVALEGLLGAHRLRRR